MANGTEELSEGRRRLLIFGVSVLILFAELFLIRWVATEIRVFAYANNLVLLACFMGLGLGAVLDARVGNVVYSLGAILLVALAGTSTHFRAITEFLSGFSDSLAWTWTGPVPLVRGAQGLVLMLFLFALIVAAFVPLGRLLAGLLDSSAAIVLAYSVNVAGSIVGIWLFTLLGWGFVPPWGWYLVTAALALPLLPRLRAARIALPLLVVATTALLLPTTSSVAELWSPYQKLTVQPFEVDGTGIANGYEVTVNNVGFMVLLDLSEAFSAEHYPAAVTAARTLNQYELPYLFKPGARRALVVGGGGGNDAAGALRRGVDRVDVVEIDPGVVALGRALHPERPYDDPRVTVHVDDARSYFRTCRERYDVVSFGLLDSHTTASSYNNTRLDHYVYTTESLRDARRLLADDGLLTLIFEPERRWIVERLYGQVEAAFGKPPLVVEVRSPRRALGWGGIMLLVGNGTFDARSALARDPALARWVEDNAVRDVTGSSVRPTSDDWPYLYVERRSIPTMYLIVVVALLALLVPLRWAVLSGGSRVDWHFFWLGAAFLLLEFQNISKASLLFGSTWVTNAYMFTAILALILLANWAASARRDTEQKRYWIYALLGGSLLLLYLTPINVLAERGHRFNALFMSSFMNVPVFFAGLVFIGSFARAPDKRRAYGSNLLGAAFGGLLESVSFVTGIRALLLLVLAFYALAAWTGARGGPGPNR